MVGHVRFMEHTTTSTIQRSETSCAKLLISFPNGRKEERRGTGFSWSTETLADECIQPNSVHKLQSTTKTNWAGQGIDCLHTWQYFHSREHNNLLNDASSSRFYRGGPSRTNLHLLALRSFHPNQEICSRVKCLPACLPVCRSAPRLSRETEQARKKGGGPRKFLVRLSLSDISAFSLLPSSSATPLRQLDSSAV